MNFKSPHTKNNIESWVHGFELSASLVQGLGLRVQDLDCWFEGDVSKSPKVCMQKSSWVQSMSHRGQGAGFGHKNV